MSENSYQLKSNLRFALVAFAVAFAILAAACEGFYSDSLPTPDIAQPTPANVQSGDPAVVLENAARQALAAILGISPEDPRMILFEDATWADRNPGCYPEPSTITGAYLIPSYRLLLQYEGVFYEYDADQGARVGALCESTFQLVPAEPAYGIVITAGSAEPDFDTIHVLRSEEDVAEFNTTNSNIASIGVDQIEWPEEVLVGGWVDVSPNPEVIRGYLSEQGTSIIIEVAIPEEFTDEANDNLSQVWVLVDITEPNSTYEFLVAE
jgi:hypothetical protein